MKPASRADLRPERASESYSRADYNSENYDRFRRGFHKGGHEKCAAGRQKSSNKQSETKAEFVDRLGDERSRQSGHQAENGKRQAELLAIQVHRFGHVGVDDAGARRWEKRSSGR